MEEKNNEIRYPNPGEKLAGIVLDSIVQHQYYMRFVRMGGDTFEELEKIDDNKRRLLKVRSLIRVISIQREILTTARPIVYNLCYSEFQNDLKMLILGIDFNSLLRHNHLTALLVVHLGSKQARYFENNEVISHIKDGLIQVASFFNNNTDADLGHFTVEQIAVGLIDDALSLSIEKEHPKEICGQFCEIAQTLFERWPTTANYMRSVIFRLTQELPASLLHGFWKLVLFSRANSKYFLLFRTGHVFVLAFLNTRIQQYLLSLISPLNFFSLICYT